MPILCVVLFIFGILTYAIAVLVFIAALGALVVATGAGACMLAASILGLFGVTAPIAIVIGVPASIVAVIAICLGVAWILVAMLLLFIAQMAFHFWSKLGCATGGFQLGNFLGAFALPGGQLSGCGCGGTIPLPPPPPGVDPARWMECVTKCMADGRRGFGPQPDNPAKRAWESMLALRDAALSNLAALQKLAEQHAPDAVPAGLTQAIASTSAEAKAYGAAAEAGAAAAGAELSKRMGF